MDLPDGFSDFYYRFHNDSIYQLDHILFPLKEKDNGENWTTEDWVINKQFELNEEEFSVTMENFNGIVTETIKANTGVFQLQRRFAKFDGQWTLIYYKEDAFLNGFDQVEEEIDQENE